MVRLSAINIKITVIIKLNIVMIVSREIKKIKHITLKINAHIKGLKK